jgi:predicted transcriptional regulator
MSIDVSPELEARLQTQAREQGVSLSSYLERLVQHEEQRMLQLKEVRERISEGVAALDCGESVDGETFMAELIAELDAEQTRISVIGQ